MTPATRTRAIACSAALGLLAVGCTSNPRSSASPRRVAPTTAAATTTSATTTTPPVVVPVLRPPTVPTTGAYFGIWRGPGPGRSPDDTTSLHAAQDAIGRHFAIVHHYYEWGAPVPTAAESDAAAAGAIPMVSICACHFGSQSVVRWARIAAGTDDAYLSTIARSFAAATTPMFLVFDAEPETNMPSRGTAADYVAAWRHVVAVFRAEHASNVAFVWATTTWAFTSGSDATAQAMAAYPGDDVVDWIGADAYNYFDHGVWNTFANTIAPWYSWASGAHPHKPLMLPEWGTKEDRRSPGRKAAWITDAGHLLATTFSAVHAVVYFDERKVEHATVNDWRIDTSPSAQQAFAVLGTQPWFANQP